ncbi:MAG: DOMON-like domain-containing protein [Burkholderiales bacterium]|nr:MAG: DOMON-like domain-containing protein [Burkholderiales bacterium]
MNALPARPLALHLHPASAWFPACGVEVSLALAGSPQGPGLLLDYRLTGGEQALVELSIPLPAGAGPADGLWRATCFELFVTTEGDTAYRELNFSPSGQWACYAFDRERERAADPLPVPTAPVVDWRAREAAGLQAWVPAALLPPQRPWRVGLSAVLVHRDGRLAYLALHHPKATPDFHDRRGWTLCPDLPLFPAFS